MDRLYQCRCGHLWVISIDTNVGTTVACPKCGGAGTTAQAEATRNESELLVSRTVTSAGTAPCLPVGAGMPDVPGYLVTDVIGKGGMGVVYRARHLALDREVALKVILAAEFAQSQDLARFRAEAETAARLHHPHIVLVYDVGQAHDRPYFTMEIVAGGSLKQRLAQRPPSPREAAELMLKLARAVAHAHQHGVVHRDLKPDNVLLDENGEPKITDFGIAKRQTEEASVTRTGAILGTPNYMAPEQAVGSRDVGPAADIHALGAILYECLAGRPPFQSETLHETLRKVINDDPPSPARLRPGVPRDLETICLKCLRKKPERRYAGAAELADDLERFLTDQPVHARRTPMWERGLKWTRRHRVATSVLAVLALLLIGGAVAGWWWYDRHERVHIDYYAGWTKRMGDYVGVGRLTSGQVAERTFSYKFHTRGGVVERIDVVDADGRLTNYHSGSLLYMDAIESPRPTVQRECSYRLERDASGRVTDETAYDRHDRVVWRFHYTSRTTAAFTDAHGFPYSRNGSGVTFLEFERNENGFESAFRYRDRDNRPRPDSDGVYGWRIDSDSRGMVERITLLDEHDKPFRIKLGYAALVYERDELGNATEIRCLDENDRLVQHKTGHAIMRARFDSAGRMVEQAYLDEQERPVRFAMSFETMRFSYPGPKIHEMELVNSDEDRGSWATRYVKSRVETLRSDDDGSEVRTSYFDKAGRPIRDHHWTAGWVESRDADGRALKRSHFGPDGKATFHKDGFVSESMTYDDDGRLTAWEGRDAEDRLIRNNEWYARMTCAYDERGRRTEERYFDERGRPTLHKSLYARKKTTYDSDGRIVAVEHFDAADRPTRTRERYFRVEFAYDERGFVKEERFFGPDGRPTWHRSGYAVLKKKHDPRGLLVSRIAHAPDGAPVADWDLLCEVRRRYDAWGNAVEESFFTADGKPTVNQENVASIHRSYDRWGNVLTISNHGIDGAKVQSSRGWFEQRNEYDGTAVMTRRTHHGIDGVLKRNNENIAEILQRSDESGYPIELQYRDENGKPTLGPRGCSRTTARFDDRGLLTAEAFFGLDPQRPVVVTEGFARFETERSAVGLEMRKRWFDAEGKPGRRPTGHAWVEWTYDGRGLGTREAYFDANGRPFVRGGGYSTFAIGHDARGNAIEESYLDARGNLVAGDLGHARALMTYNDRDMKTSVKYFDAGGKPWTHPEGYAAVAWTRNDCDETLEQSFHDAAGRLVVVKSQGFAKVRDSYSIRGYLLGTEYFDADEKPMLGPNGFARSVITYDDANRQTGTEYYDKEGRRLRRRIELEEVVPGGRADKLGLKVGDILTHYAGKEIDGTAGYQRVRATEKPGDPKRILRVLRAGKPWEFPIEPGMLQVRLRDRLVPEGGN